MFKKISILLVAVLIISSSAVLAQKAKYAFIQKDSVLLSMPEMQQADKEITAFVNQLQSEITKMQTEHDGKVKDYEKNKATGNELVLNNKIQDINDLGKRIQDFQVSAQEEIIKKREEIYTPVADKFNKAIETVAKKKGYSAVFPSNTALYFNPKDDITELVLIELGIK